MTTENSVPHESREAALGRMTDAVFALDDDWRVTYLNDHAEELLGADTSELLGEALWDAFPEARGTTFYREYRRAVSEQEPVSFEEYYDPLGAWFSVRAYPSETGLTVHFRDVTEERERRVELEREQERLAARDRFDEVLTDITKLGTTVSSLSSFESSLVDRLHRVDGVHAVRMDRVDTDDDSTELAHCAGPSEFDVSSLESFDSGAPREVTHVPISETSVERFDSVSHGLVFVPLVTADESRSVLTLAVDDVFGGQVAQSVFEHLSDTVEFVAQSLCRREKWRSVAGAFEQLDAGAYVVDADGVIVWANDSFAEYVGIDSIEIVDSDHELFVERRLQPIFDDSCDLTSCLVASESATDHSKSGDCVARISAGHDRDGRVLEHDARPIQTGGFDGGTVHVFTDITDRQTAEESLAETEWVRSSLLDNFPGMAYRCRNTKQWEMDYVAGRIESLTGYTAEEIRSSVSWGETIVDSRDTDDVWTAVQSQLEESDTFELTYRIVRRDGTTRWVWDRGQRVETPEGDRLAGFVMDVTEKRKAKNQLRLNEIRFQSLVEHVSEYAIFTVNRDGCIESWNDGAEYITGFSMDEAIGMHLSSLVPDEKDDRYLSASNMTEAVMRGESHGEGWIRTKDGETFWAQVVLRAIVGNEGDDVRGFVAVVRDMTEQRQRRRELEHQRDELVTLNRINAVVRDIDRALVQARSRQEICEAICERLTDDDRYELAWIGESDPSRNVVRPIEWAGAEGEYVENLEVSMEGDRGSGPVGKSLRTNSVAVTQRISADPEFEPWRERALEHGLNSSASVPIEYGGIPYGTLCVYSGDAEAFDEREKQLLAELGEMVGYAFNAVDRKQALVADSMTEITFELSESLEGVAGLTDVTDGRITLTSTVRTQDETFLQYLRTEGVDPDDVEAVLENNEHVRSVEVLWSDGTEGSLSVSSDSSLFIQTVSVYGGRLDEIVAEDGVVTANVRFPQGTDVHAVTDQLRSEYPEIAVKAKRDIRPENEAQRLAELVEDELTDRQAEVLKTAYHSGYYEWPRDTNGTELSDRLGLSAATLSQHLRAAHDTVVGSVVEHRLQ